MSLGWGHGREVTRGFSITEQESWKGAWWASAVPSRLAEEGKTRRELTFLWLLSKLTAKSGFPYVLGTLTSNCIKFQNWGLFLNPSTGLRGHEREVKIGPRTPPHSLVANPWQGLLKPLVMDHLACLRQSCLEARSTSWDSHREGITEVGESAEGPGADRQLRNPLWALVLVVISEPAGRVTLASPFPSLRAHFSSTQGLGLVVL